MTALLEAENLVKHFPASRNLFGRPTAFVCEHATCKLPTSDADELARQLRQVQPLILSSRMPQQP